MYLQYYALAFFLFYFIDKENWYTWILLSILCSLLKCNTVLFDVIVNSRYTVRTTLIFIFATLLMKEYSKISGYQSFILLLFLLANFLMLRHPSSNNYFYANYEAIIYGLVSCQFIAIIPRIWCCISHWYTSYFFGNEDKQLVGRV